MFYLLDVRVSKRECITGGPFPLYINTSDKIERKNKNHFHCVYNRKIY